MIRQRTKDPLSKPKAPYRKPVATKQGRPPVYNETHDARAYYLCSKFGLTNEALAEAFGVTTITIEDWLRDRPSFSRSVREGRWACDSDTVAKSLFKRATGYRTKDEKIFVHEGEVIRVETEKEYPPDPTSMIFWLCNRQKQHWRREVKHEVSGPDGSPIESKVHAEIETAGNQPLSVVLGNLSKDKLVGLKEALLNLVSDDGESQ